MKRLILILALLISSCGTAQIAPNAPAPSPSPSDSSAAVVEPTCARVDMCTYEHYGFESQPKYFCREQSYAKSEHPEIDPGFFQDKQCLTIAEDWQISPGFCGPNHMPCQLMTPGPGPRALPGMVEHEE